MNIARSLVAVAIVLALAGCGARTADKLECQVGYLTNHGHLVKDRHERPVACKRED